MSNIPSNQRPCTCHPTDRPPTCQHRYGARECQDAYHAYKATRVTVSCLCGTRGCNAEVCNPTTFKLATLSVENRDLRAALAAAVRPADETTCSAADYEEVLADHRRLVRELDVALNGDGAARQASLCDIVGQVKDRRWKLVRAEEPTCLCARRDGKIVETHLACPAHGAACE